MRKLSSTGVIAFAGMLACTLSITPASTRKRADVRGIITHISRSESQKNVLGRILIEGTKDSDTQVDKANLTITTETKIFVERYGEHEPATIADLREGQLVEASFIGPVMESYPVQAKAGEITILFSNQSKNTFGQHANRFKPKDLQLLGSSTFLHFREAAARQGTPAVQSAIIKFRGRARRQK